MCTMPFYLKILFFKIDTLNSSRCRSEKRRSCRESNILLFTKVKCLIFYMIFAFNSEVCERFEFFWPTVWRDVQKMLSCYYRNEKRVSIFLIEIIDQQRGQIIYYTTMYFSLFGFATNSKKVEQELKDFKRTVLLLRHISMVCDFLILQLIQHSNKDAVG